MALYPKSRARRLRQDETSGEAKAWEVLRQLRGHGFPVRRQHPIEGMIVDFAIPRAKLVIELDGSIHNQIEVAERDSERDKALAEAGWSVIRLKNDEAFDPDHLFRAVCDILGI